MYAEFTDDLITGNEMIDEEGPSDAFVSKVAENVRDWLYYHIKGFDRSVAEYKYMRDSADRI